MNPYDPMVQTLAPPLILSNLNSDDIECETKARQKLTDWGFDPFDVEAGSKKWYGSQLRPSSNISYDERESRPMVIFANLGDLPMMRYIMLKSTNPSEEMSKTDEYGLFPLYTAITEPHNEEHIIAVCGWLCNNGADIKQTVGGEWSPLSKACLKGFERVALWLLSSGALLNADGSFDADLAKRDLPSCGYEPCGYEAQKHAYRIHQKIFAWARQIVSTQSIFLLFLTGTLKLSRPSVDPKQSIEHVILTCGYYPVASVSFLLQDIPDEKLNAFLEMASSPLVVFNGLPGILELISEYVSIERNRKILCTAKGLVEHEKWWNLRVPLWLTV
jgi:hypothetical protein